MRGKSGGYGGSAVLPTFISSSRFYYGAGGGGDGATGPYSGDRGDAGAVYIVWYAAPPTASSDSYHDDDDGKSSYFVPFIVLCVVFGVVLVSIIGVLLVRRNPRLRNHISMTIHSVRDRLRGENTHTPLPEWGLPIPINHQDEIKLDQYDTPQEAPYVVPQIILPDDHDHDDESWTGTGVQPGDQDVL
eukprot:TRINITY_DN10533_c0_g1_i1.p1 TRINITY_DN10533_c0_g1~~TRINITY_DN10533_c0_g1_i1.p1  ORF type:complete len:188 (+),score=23.45 TRINITY_DN10533_c0_g1_i1:460-1023(+)